VLPDLPTIYVVGLDGKPPRPVRPDVLDQFIFLRAAWHPDGRRVSIWGRTRTSAMKFLNLPLDGSRADSPEMSQQVERDLASRGSSDTPVALWIYKAGSNGFPVGLSDFSSCTSPCYQYTWNSGTSHFVRQSGAWSSPVVCGLTHDSIGVYLKMSHAPIGFANFLGTLNINERTVMTLEPPNPNNCPSGS